MLSSRPRSVVSSPSILRRPTAPRAPTARKPCTVRCSSTVILQGRDKEYRRQLDQPGKFLGTTTVYLDWRYQDGEDDYLEMIRAFAARPGFPNVSTIHLNAPHLLLNGEMIGEIARSKPKIRELHVDAWAYSDADGPCWEFDDLRDVHVTFSGTQSFPSSFDHFNRQLPRTLRKLAITDSGPHYGRVDCALLPVATEVTQYSNITIDESRLKDVERRLKKQGKSRCNWRFNCRHG